MNVSVLIKFSKKTSVFYLNYHKFSIKSYVLDVYENRLGEAILIHIHNILFYGEILKIIHLYYFDSDPRFPPFLLYVRWKSGVTLVWRCFRDVKDIWQLISICCIIIRIDFPFVVVVFL